MNRTQTRILTSCAAASIVLTIGPGLIAPVGATAAQASNSANSRAIDRPAAKIVARAALRSALRAARTNLRKSQRTANSRFREAVAPDRATLQGAHTSSATIAERRLARIALGEATLPARISRNAELLAAHEAYAAAVEQARVDFVTAIEAKSSVIARITYRQAVHTATAAHQRAIQAARGTMRQLSAPARHTLRTALASATTDEQRAEAWQAFRAATADSTGMFRVSLADAGTKHKTALAAAKAAFRASMAASIATAA